MEGQQVNDVLRVMHFLSSVPRITPLAPFGDVGTEPVVEAEKSPIVSREYAKTPAYHCQTSTQSRQSESLIGLICWRRQNHAKISSSQTNSSHVFHQTCLDRDRSRRPVARRILCYAGEYSSHAEITPSVIPLGRIGDQEDPRADSTLPGSQ